ncbi:MAG TPA: TAXI family TRAP transporter solute-binding subunit [Blastocatellia bacterium]|nr:TAXI family TRAP transporter solute-binding subunit [Blastocatellia bacterium]
MAIVTLLSSYWRRLKSYLVWGRHAWTRLALWRKVTAAILAFVFIYSLVDWAWAERYILSTGTKGGTYYKSGEILKDILNRHFDSGLPVHRTIFEAKASEGSVQNVEKIVRGEAQLAISQDGLPVTVLKELHGNQQFSHQVRAIANLYKSRVYIVVRKPDSLNQEDLVTIEDLKKIPQEKLYIGFKGSGTRTVAESVLHYYGLDNLINSDENSPVEAKRNRSFEDAEEALKRGELLAGIFLVGPEAPVIIRLMTSGMFRLISIDRAEGIQSVQPYLSVGKIPAAAFPMPGKCPPEDVATLEINEILVCDSELDESVVYEITKALKENAPELVSKMPSMSGVAPIQPQTAYYPLHPGAARYYSEQGVPPVIDIHRLTTLVPLLIPALPLLFVSLQWFHRRRLVRRIREITQWAQEKVNAGEFNEEVKDQFRQELDSVRNVVGELYVKGIITTSVWRAVNAFAEREWKRIAGLPGKNSGGGDLRVAAG